MNKNGMTDVGAGTRAVDQKIDTIKDTMKGLVDDGAQRVGALKNRVIEVKDQAMHRGGELLDRTADLIKAHPLKAVGIAFVAGFLGMRLFRR